MASSRDRLPTVEWVNINARPSERLTDNAMAERGQLQSEIAAVQSSRESHRQGNGRAAAMTIVRSISGRFKLNMKQRYIFMLAARDFFFSHFGFDLNSTLVDFDGSYTPLLCHLGGEAGTGKTHVLEAIVST